MNQILQTDSPGHIDLLSQIGYHLERQGQESITTGTLSLYFQQTPPRPPVVNKFPRLDRLVEEMNNNQIYMEFSYDRQFLEMGLTNYGVIFSRKGTQVQQKVVRHPVEKSVL